MSDPHIEFDTVWKKFRRGERHDSLRDLLPALLTGTVRRGADRLETDEFWVLRDVSLEVKAGETLGIIGRNGAGKSTTLKLLTRILKPTRGRCLVQGRVGALIELAAGFHPDLTGRENVYLQGAVMGMRRAEIAKRFDAIVEFAGIGDFIDTQVKRYSSGMNARLGFSVAAFLDPEVLLIDEVLAVGDLSFQQKCFERLHEFKRSGVAIAFVSHNMQAISALCDRVLYLRPQGPPLVGSVGDAITEYVKRDAASDDPRVKVLACELRRENSDKALVDPVPPGTWLSLRLAVEASIELPGVGVALIVHRADGLMVFNGSSLLDGEAPLHLVAEEPMELGLTFRANLTRGVYTTSVLLFEQSRLWPTIDLGITGSFVVHETTRSGGVADLEVRYDLPLPRPLEGSPADAGRYA